MQWKTIILHHTWYEAQSVNSVIIELFLNDDLHLDISSDCKCDDHLLNEQQWPQFTPSVSEAPTAVHESLNAGEYSHLPTGEEAAETTDILL